MDQNIDNESNFRSHGDEVESLETQLSTLSLQGTPKSPDEVLTRCKILLEELRIFANYCESKKYNGDYRQKPEYNHFRGDIKGEVKQMEKLKSTPDLPPERASQLVNASNLTYWEALWNAAKQTKELLTLRRHGSPIDIISENGSRWTKVSTVTEKRLLMEMAKQGWDWAGSDEDSDEDDSFGSGSRSDDDVDISIVKMAIQLRNLAKGTRVRYRNPQIHFILTRIRPGNKDIDSVLDHIRATGAIVHTADQVTPAPPVTEILDDLAINEFKHFSPTLNVDCTLLLAIVSDISHGQVKEEPWFNRNVRNQIAIEEEEQLMPRSLWPAMAGHRLVCTKLAAKRMSEIVNTIGTATEKERMNIMMGLVSAKSREDLLEQLGKLSEHAVPSEWQLPIAIEDEDDLEAKYAGRSHREVMEKGNLVDVNRSVFMYGWLSGNTTITSNRVAVKAIEKAVEDKRKSDDDRGPDVWICPIARSLVAKEKNRDSAITRQQEESGRSTPQTS